MTEQDLKKKFTEWLTLRKSVADLTKAKLNISLGSGVGSISGIDIGGNPEKKKKQSVSVVSGGTVAAPAVGGGAAGLAASELEKVKAKPVNPKDPVLNHGKFPIKAKTEEQQQDYFAKIAQYLKNKSMKKASELDKAKVDENKAWGEKRHARSDRKGVEEKGVHAPDSDSSGQSKAGARYRASNAPDHGMYGISHPKTLRPAAIESHKAILNEVKAMPKPNLPKSEDMAKADEHIVAGIKVPHELKAHKGPVPADHPHREIAAKFVSDVWKKHKPSGQRMSEKYLGVSDEAHPQYSSVKDRYATIKSEVKAIPAGVSEPVISNHISLSNPKEINEPTVFNSYKSEGDGQSSAKIISFLKSKRQG